MNNASIYVWDTTQFPELKQGSDSNLKQATKDFEKLRRIPMDAISPSIIELGKRLSAEAETINYSDVFIDSYLNAENEIPDQPKLGAVAIPSPDVSQVEAPIPVEQLFDSELLSVMRPMAKELGLVIYDLRGAVYYPDGNIYPPKLAKAVEKQDQVEEQLRQNAKIYQPNEKLPSKYKDFELLVIPFIHECMLKNGYKTLGKSKANSIPYYYKQFKHHKVVITMGGNGTFGDFLLNANLYYFIPKFDEYYKQIDEIHVQKVHDSDFTGKNNKLEPSIGLLMVFHYLSIQGLQKQIEVTLISTLEKRLQEIQDTDILKLFEIYHQKSREDHERGYTVVDPDREILLAKLANHPNFDELMKEYQGYVDIARPHLIDRIVPRWQKMLEIIDNVEPVVVKFF
jgi:hypothetical protein